MSNEEQMRKEFESTGLFNVNPTFREVAWEGYKAATARKQQEIAELNQQVLELSAQVEVMQGALYSYDKAVKRAENLSMFADRYARESVEFQLADARGLVSEALSITPSAALESHDNEVAAKALEEAMQSIVGCLDTGNDAYEVIYRMVEERRNRK